ncbi:DNA polymerase IV, partial [Candidatus Omnitrophota bacterium]
ALLVLSEKVSDRLRAGGIKGRTVTLKIRLEGFKTYTRAHTLTQSTNYADVIYGRIVKLFTDFERKGKKVRLVGVKVSNLAPAGLKESIFEDINNDKREKIHTALEKIRQKLGPGAISRAGGKLYDR